MSRVRRAGTLLAVLLLAVTAACTADKPATVTLRVLASSDLTDLRPVLDRLEHETGVRLVMDYRGTVDAGDALTPPTDEHDLAWLSSDRYLRLKLKAAGYTGPVPLSTKIMDSPVAIGLTPAAADRLPDRPTWADIADAAAAGRLGFAMADPRHAGSGLAALIGVATAATGAGRALRPEDVTCDRLGGFFAGRRITATSTADLVARFVAGQDSVDALISYESVLLSVNAGGRLRQPLRIVYPRDGIVLAEYPLLLLNPRQRAAYDKAVAWLTGADGQRMIMRTTLRRPVDPAVTRDPRLGPAIGNSLYFPDQQETIDRLLANYRAGGRPGHVIFVLDYSGSMRGARLAKLRATFDGLGGVDRTSSGKFARFYPGERITLIRFGRTVLGERTFTVEDQADIDAMRAFLGGAEPAGRTAVWSALDHAYRIAATARRAESDRPVSIVLMTDGENNAGAAIDGLLPRWREVGVPTYAISLARAAPPDLGRAASATGGRVAEATTDNLRDAFKDVRGCG
ncbi:substrate-binding domain-containing protein [Actinoplanes sp. NPDC049265]|uniref:substrate-binding domain-containing protein n=1 Tax=Actinoplanes sp. NPDC049265 TaxID=3363902 RepID=UPI003718217D